MTSERCCVLYHTAGCHLCELAEALVSPIAHDLGWKLEEVDIALEDALYARYGLRIPVLCVPAMDREIGWPFDAEAARALLASCAAALDARKG